MSMAKPRLDANTLPVTPTVARPARYQEGSTLSVLEMSGLLASPESNVSSGTRGEPIEVVSSLTRAGRPFLPRAELELAPALRQAASRIPSARGAQTVMVPECPLPVGVPDLIALVADIQAVGARSAAGVEPLLGEQEARMVAACGVVRPRSLTWLASIAGISEGHARRVLLSLERRGALDRRVEGWVRHPALQPIGRTYAIEAKVSDWRAGISQCLRYSTLADASALALGSLSDRSRAQVVAAAKEHGVGLFVEERWLVRPRVSRLFAARRLWVSEHVAAALGIA